jgi:hypothetical protein
LEDIDKSQRQSGDVDDEQGGIVCIAEDLFALGEGEVEDEDGGLYGHQSRVLVEAR